jgi:uncharacterized membrane protein (UPF0127 family)
MVFNIRRGGFLLAAFAVSAAALNCQALNREGARRFETRDMTIERSGVPPVPLRAEIARTDEERRRGLMYRKELADGEGMLFVHDRDQILRFWMKDTLIPLSIAFIAADGRILEIRSLEPEDQRTVNSSRSARYALEVPRDWFSRAGINTGDILRLDF